VFTAHGSMQSVCHPDLLQICLIYAKNCHFAPMEPTNLVSYRTDSVSQSRWMKNFGGQMKGKWTAEVENLT